MTIHQKPGFRFATPSGKIEIHSARLAAAGFDAMPRYTPPEDPPEGFARLIYGRSPVHSFSRTQNNRLLSRIQDENEIWVHPAMAAASGLSTGDRVWLVNQDGVRTEFPIKVRVTERIRKDCVYTVHGFGHTDRRLRRAYGKGASDTSVITRYAVDPLIGSSGMRVNFVRLEKDA